MPDFGDQFEMNQFLHSPLPDLLHDFEGSPEVPMFDDLILDDPETLVPGTFEPNITLFAELEGVIAPSPTSGAGIQNSLPLFDMTPLLTNLPTASR